MITKDKIYFSAVKTFETEADSIRNLKNFIDEKFVQCVEMIHHNKGRVIITGIGKSAIVAGKIVSTLNSTGTPSIFMHAADAVHGDLGTIQSDDVVICISNSGETPEIKVLVPLLKIAGNKLIAMTGNTSSFLAKNADFVLNTHVEKEACPHNLAPTSSTTAQMAMGDALAVCLLELNDFTDADFAKYHPGGALGKQLYLHAGYFTGIHDRMNEKPQVSPDSSISDVIVEISSKHLGATAVIEDGRIAGIVTDGDLRRMLEKNTDFRLLKASDIMSSKPRMIDANTLAVDALQMMKMHNITQLIVTENDVYAGFLHLHDLLKEGII